MLTGLTRDFPLDEMAADLKRLAERGIWLGTSSWKYAGWVGQLYDEQRYLWRGKFSESRFERECLREYAAIFPTVCVDAGYYRFPTAEYLAGLVSQVPRGFRFSFKVTDEITARTFPNLPRHGARAGLRNEHFLNAGLFKAAFLDPLERCREAVGTLIFEFSHFHPRDFARGREFMELLDAFLGELPSGWDFAVEVRNRSLLCTPYFEMLHRHGVAHVFNSWDKMPPVDEQMASIPAAAWPVATVARFLLKPGRSYETAVAAFSPYSATKEVNKESRHAMAALIARRLREIPLVRGRHSCLYVNNRLEGNALNTIAAVIRLLKSDGAIEN
jgi:uncharacterized protein YecE (DUF72 family)